MEQNKFIRSMPITASLSIMVCTAILLSTLLSVYFYNLRMEYLYKSEIRNEMEMLSGAVVSQISSALYTRTYETVNEIMKMNIGRNELITDAMIVLKEDNRIYYDILGAEESSREGKTFSRNMMMDDEGVYLSRTIVFNAGLASGQPMESEEIGQLVLCYREMEPLRRERLLAMVSLARSMSLNLAAAVDRGHFTKMRDIMVNIIDSSLSLEYSQLLNNDGMFLYYYENGLSIEAMHAKEGEKVTGDAGRRALKVSDRKSLLIQDITMPGGKEVMDLTVPIMRKGKRIGVARIGYSMEDFQAAQNRTRRNLVVMTVGMILTGLLMAVFFSIRISKSIRELAATVRLVGTGSYLEKQIHVSSNLQEVRELEVSFNEMIEKRRAAEYELTRREEQLRELARRVISAQEQERSRISKELHDELGHRLISLSLRLAAIRKKKLLPEQEIDVLTNLLEETSGEVMRIFRGLSPSFIDRFGLSEALNIFTEIFQTQNNIRISTDIDTFEKEDLPQETSINLFRIAQESFNNIIKHSKAENVTLTLKKNSAGLELTISDDGRGMVFDWISVRGGMGMIGMRERAYAMGGDLEVTSSPGNGTVIKASVPQKSLEEGDSK